MRIILVFLFLSISCFGFQEVDPVLDQYPQLKNRIDSIVTPVPLTFDKKKINFFKEQPAFDYSEKVSQENWWTRFKHAVQIRWNNFLEWLFGDYRINNFLLFFLELLPYLILVFLLFLITWLFAKLNPAASFLGTPQEGKVFLTEEEEIIQSRNIRKLIENAVSEENYRLAIRFQFLQILQLLTEKNFITYNFPKTDTDYLAEIEPKSLQEQFRQLTRIYNFIWYGSFEAQQKDYEKAKKEFQKMQELIDQKNEQNQ